MTKGIKSIAPGHTIARYEIESPCLRTELVLAWSPNAGLCHEYTCTRRKAYREYVGEGGPDSKQRGTAVLAGSRGSVSEPSFDSGKQHVGVC